MADTIFGNTPFTSAMQGYAQGVEAQTYKEKDKARTGLLTDQADLSRMNVTSIKEKAALDLQERSLESRVLSDNPELEVKTGQQRDSFLSSLLAKPEVRSNPLLAAHIIDKQKKNQLDLADSYVAKGKVDTQQRDFIANGINRVLVNPTDPSTLDSIDELSKTEGLPETDRRNLMGLKAILSGKSPVPPTYWSTPGKPQSFASLSPNEQQRLVTDVQTHYNLAKNATKDTIAVQEEIRKQARDAELSRLKEEELAVARQRVAAAREGIKQRGDKARDKSDAIAKEERTYSTDTNKIEGQQLKILTTAGVADPEAMLRNWMTLGLTEKNALNEGQRAAYEALEKQKQQRLEVKERNIAKFKAVDQTPNPPVGTKENPIKLD